MKVLFVTSFIGKSFGGAEISTGLLKDALIKQGCSLQALTTRKIRANDNLIPISFPIEIPKKLMIVGNSGLDYCIARKIKNQMDKFNPDVIHVQDTYSLPAATLANKHRRLPIVATIRNSVVDKTWDLMFPVPISNMLKRRNKTIIKALHEIDHIIAVSHYIENELIERGINPEKITTIYNLPPTVKNAQQKYSMHSPIVHLFAPGLLARFKGFSVLIKAMKAVTESNPNVVLIIAGTGPQKKSLQKLTDQLMLNRYIKFVGNVQSERLYQLYLNSDVIIFPSNYPEPFGRVALEASHFGKAIVASRVGGIPEVVEHQKNGLLVPPDNPEILAESILSLIQNDALRKSMGRFGKEIVQTKFNPRVLVNQTLKLYLQIIASNRGNTCFTHQTLTDMKMI